MDNFHRLEMKWGAPAAYHYLSEVEKVAKIPSWEVAAIDPETRLANAIRTQDAMREAV